MGRATADGEVNSRPTDGPVDFSQGWWIVIALTRLNGQRFAVNPDLIERAESTPDTVLTLVDGTKFLVLEDLDALIGIVHEHRASIVARAIELADSDPVASVATVTGIRPRPHLSVPPEVD